MTSRASSARALAFEALRRVEERGAFADAVLGSSLARRRLSPSDQALATRLVYGTLAWQGRLDWHLSRLCTTPLPRLDSWLRVILRLGLYQILFLDRVPAYAAVDTSVELARRFRHGAATGLVNATLRRAAANAAALTLPDDRTDPVGIQAICWSHPRWLVARWHEELDSDTVEGLLRANQEPAPTVLRANTLRTDRAALVETLMRAGFSNVHPTHYSPVGVHLGAPLSEASAAIPSDWSTRQNEASQLVAYFVAPQPGERILDACAAPGGKATHLAALMQNRGQVLAVDISQRGLAHVRERAEALGASIISTRHADARELPNQATLPGEQLSFDRVLVDAPCSGLGTLRAHPELRWRLGPDDLHTLAQLQSEILAAVAPLCIRGGVLVYATCTISRVENEGVVQQFLSTHPDFSPEDAAADLPAAVSPLVKGGILRTSPHRHGLDGFFAVRLRRYRVSQ